MRRKSWNAYKGRWKLNKSERTSRTAFFEFGPSCIVDIGSRSPWDVHADVTADHSGNYRLVNRNEPAQLVVFLSPGVVLVLGCRKFGVHCGQLL